MLPSLSYAALACILEECRIAAAAERSVLFECVPDLSHVMKDERRSCQKHASESCEMSTVRHWRRAAYTLGQSGTPEWRFQTAFTVRVHLVEESGFEASESDGKRYRERGAAVAFLTSMYV